MLIIRFARNDWHADFNRLIHALVDKIISGNQREIQQCKSVFLSAKLCWTLCVSTTNGDAYRLQ